MDESLELSLFITIMSKPLLRCTQIWTVKIAFLMQLSSPILTLLEPICIYWRIFHIGGYRSPLLLMLCIWTQWRCSLLSHGLTGLWNQYQARRLISRTSKTALMYICTFWFYCSWTHFMQTQQYFQRTTRLQWAVMLKWHSLSQLYKLQHTSRMTCAIVMGMNDWNQSLPFQFQMSEITKK